MICLNKKSDGKWNTYKNGEIGTNRSFEKNIQPIIGCDNFAENLKQIHPMAHWKVRE